MITRLWPLTLLVTQIVLGYDHKIDLERCNKDTACFIRETCIEHQTPPTKAPDAKKLVHYSAGKLIDDGCDVILQTKALTKTMLHVMMQVKLSGTDKIKVDDGLTIFQEENVFACKPSGITGSSKFDTSPLGKQTPDEQHFFCSFFATLKTPDFYLTFSPIASPPILKYTNKDDTPVEVKFSDDGAWFWMFGLAKLKCDRALVSSPDKDQTTDTILTAVDIVFDDLKCSIDPPGPPSFVVQVKDKPPITTSKIICDETDNKKSWKYDASGTMKPITTTANGKFEAHCSEKVCRKCDAPPAHLSSCTKCEAIKVESAGQDPNNCAKLTCPGNKKLTTTGPAFIKESPECRRSKSDPGKFVWFVGKDELKEAACLDKLDCVAPKEVSSTNLKRDNNSITCVSGYKLKLHPDANDKEKGEFALDNKIECNPDTGHFVDPNKFQAVSCKAEDKPPKTDPQKGGFFSEYGIPIYIVAGSALLMALVGLAGCIYWRRQKKNNKGKGAKTDADTKQSSEKKTSEMKDKSSLTSNSATASAMSAAPGGVDGSEGKKKSSKRSKRDSKKSSKKSKKENKFKLEDFETWDNEQFTKKILPNFNTVSVESKAKWLRNHMCRFYAYCNTKKTPECGTFNQFWLLVKRCMDDKCEDAIVWTLLWRTAFTMAFSVIEKTNHSDEFRLLVIKPFETYMVEYLKKCDLYKRKDESRSETEMRVICIEILLHTRHPDVTEELRKLTFNEKLEVPLRMLTAACLTRERDENKASAVMLQFKRVSDSSVLDPHINEGWGTYLQHCVYGLGAYNITEKEVYQDFFFDAMYQKDHQKNDQQERRFAPTDWLYAFKGALLHENSAKVALEKFKKLNDHCLLHIEVLLKKNHEDPTDLAKTREMYKLDMKEYTLMLADLLVGEDEFNDFKPHLRFVAIYIGEHAKAGEPLDEERIRERAINMGNMVRDRNFFKESCDSLKSIGAKNV